MGLLVDIQGRTRSLVDHVSSVKMPCNSTGPEQLLQQPRGAHAVFGSEGLKLRARLALTRRYSVYKPPSSDELREFEIGSGKENGAAAAATKICTGQPDFRANPPSLALLEDTLRLLERIARELHPSVSTHTSLASSVRLFLKTEENEHNDPSQVLESCQFRGSCANEKASEAQRFLLTRLMQQSYRSVRDGDVCRKLRLLHMRISELEQQCRGEKTIPKMHLDAASDDAFDLIATNDFSLTCLVASSQSNGEMQERREQEGHGTAALLHIRMMLRSEPFFVLCRGAAHMGAFLQLARRAELYLQLLPINGHRQDISR